MYNIWRKPTKKERKRRQLEENIRKGRVGEEAGKFRKAVLEGWNLKKTGRGSDYEGTRYNLFTGRTEKKYFEFKSSRTAPTSKLQKKMKRKKKGRYEVVVEEPIIY